MLTIAHSELAQIVRNRAVLITSLLMPVAASAFFIYQREGFERIGSLGYKAAVIVFTIGAFSLYATIVTTLAARRQTLFLKRLRSTAAADPAILSGLVVPVGVISMVQVALIIGVFAAVSERPADVPVLVVAIVATFGMMIALRLATAGVTNSPEQAQVTTLPIALGTIAVASWVGIAGTESLTWLKRLLPGGLATELVVDTWNGGLPIAGRPTSSSSAPSSATRSAARRSPSAPGARRWSGPASAAPPCTGSGTSTPACSSGTGSRR